MLGNGRLEAMCFDGTKRLCHIRGKLRKKVGMSWTSSRTFFPSSTHRKPPDVMLSRRVLNGQSATVDVAVWTLLTFCVCVCVCVWGSQSAVCCCMTRGNQRSVLFPSRFGLTRQTSSWSAWEITRCVGRSDCWHWADPQCDDAARLVLPSSDQ